MSTRVDLSFYELPHPNLSPLGIAARLIRLASKTQVWNGSSWLPPEVAWVDSGAPLTVLPKSVWEKAAAQVIANDVPLSIAGHNMLVDIGEVWLAISDGAGNASPILSVRAFLSQSNDLPMLLGMEDILTRCALHCDHAGKIAYLEFP